MVAILPQKTITVGDAIRVTRANVRMNVRDFGAELGVTHSTISMWERGVMEPDTEKISAWFNDPREWLRDMATEIFVARYRSALMYQRNSESTTEPQPASDPETNGKTK